MTADRLHEPTDEPHEQLDPESYCTVCGWAGDRGGTCQCDDGTPRS